ncbi:hypothetical protein L2E82_31858 [Cichorium intybus]|uniref:Uncharacterized protein n=1 Tax=Cichorium intybus TaxID=13427 RepID=A0ACB9BF39_CICIN|nr:hypothetical protein L2E82_31858 [Cichorium intybus]
MNNIPKVNENCLCYFGHFFFSLRCKLTPSQTRLSYCREETAKDLYYNSLPPVTKTYATICFATTAAYHIGLCNPFIIALFYHDVVKRFQIWRLTTNFFFLGSFSLTFAFRLLIILHYGVSLERGPFDKRTADYVWMFFFGAFSSLAMAATPFYSSPFMGASLVFMIVYVWSRELHGVLFIMGYDCARLAVWEFIEAAFAWNRCRPFILLLDRSSPSCGW